MAGKQTSGELSEGFVALNKCTFVLGLGVTFPKYNKENRSPWTLVSDNYVRNNLLCILHSSLCLIFTTAMVKIVLFLSFDKWESWGSKSFNHASPWQSGSRERSSELECELLPAARSLRARACQPACAGHPPLYCARCRQHRNEEGVGAVLEELTDQ